jgi:hypothetical protein
MHLPKLDPTLPDLDSLTGVFGSLADFARVQSSDDSIVILMTFLYERGRPSGARFSVACGERPVAAEERPPQNTEPAARKQRSDLYLQTSCLLVRILHINNTS